jgi:hypothetical protein
MGMRKPFTYKICATCECWGGSRRTTTYRDQVEYNSDNDKGECYGGRMSPSLTEAGRGACPTFEKWSVLTGRIY